ncbi:5-carboxymethyl-2-hydroxymuconate Delta-isomerase [Geomicrobium sp. JCM 19038]|uniref:5-carboxymethyl-2-hydroxymuconate Delta-isomerase n=1 Tax=Geomicrobium sp. JCM 19038 TaxID=1460635 RepID=UPI00045F22D9|nr:5-carboxymethyl-2-hydroxymuconate Delta-isomerase [Geomicrobium sp. JCM 19038]GAK09414.1 5-carboxymethyl-2-hydroxymuconate delta-isomerase [Geomicrobium sp. JCM 19038]
MPHFIIEYTDNVKDTVQIRELLLKVNTVLRTRSDLFPIGGIRCRATMVEDYVIADDLEDDAFVHATLKIGAGRTNEEKTEVCEAIFKELSDHFQPLLDTRYLALSFELQEFSGAGTYKLNNIHTRFKR